MFLETNYGSTDSIISKSKITTPINLGQCLHL